MKHISRSVILIATTFTILALRCYAHPRHTDPTLSELNDYLPAIQFIKDTQSTPQAAELINQWLVVRQATWDLMNMMDKEGFSADSPEVADKITNSKNQRQHLLKSCRSFFASQVDLIPTIKISLTESGIKIDSLNQNPEVEQFSRQIVLIAMTNHRSHPQHLEMRSDPSRQILFWSKEFLLHADQTRYSLAYIAPTKTGHIETSIYIDQDHKNISSFRIEAECRPTKQPAQNEKPFGKSIKISITDALTHKPLAARIKVTDKENNSFHAPLRGDSYEVNVKRAGFTTPLWDFQAGPYFYINGNAELGVDPAGKTIRIYHGYEYRPVEMSVPENGIVDVKLHRWTDMASKGWYSGQTHIHTTDIGMPVNFSHNWPMLARAEDLKVSNILTLKGEWEIPIYANEYPMGIVPWASDDEYIITYAEEYRSNPYGHLCLLGIDELIEPVSSGTLGELLGPDYPPNTYILDEAKNQGGVSIGAHFGSVILEDRPIQSGSWPSTGYEMPIDIALGKMHLAEIYGAGGQINVWYKLLNCGFEVAATAGPDWAAKDSPRVYVYLGGKDFTLDNWLKALERGISFITFGPMMEFTIDGELPGTRLSYESYPQTVRVKASAQAMDSTLPVEIVVNGKVVASGNDLDQEIVLEDSCWVAARCQHAHTSPVYVTMAGRTRGNAEDAEDFIAVIKRLENWINTKARFDNDAQKQTMLNVLDQGMNVYKAIKENHQ